MIKAIAVDDEPLALDVIQSLCNKSGSIQLERKFTKPNEALQYLSKFPIDLIFCDVKMPAMTGLQLASALPKNVMLIFTTAFSEYAAVSYELNAIDYLLKPINQRRFDQAIKKATDFYNYINPSEKLSSQYLFVRADFSLVKIPINDILYIEGLADYLKIHLQDRPTVVVRMPMKEMILKLPSSEFLRIHRSYILPYKRIDAVRGNIVFSNGQEFPIGVTFFEEFISKYKK